MVGNLRVKRNEWENTGIIKDDVVRIALNKVKEGKAAGSDGVHTKMIKKGDYYYYLQHHSYIKEGGRRY